MSPDSQISSDPSSSSSLHSSQSASLLEVALQSLPVGIAWASLADGTFAFMNRKFCEMFGYQLGELRSVDDFIGRAYPFKEDRTHFRQPLAAHLAGDGENYFKVPPQQVRILCKDGTIKTVLQARIVIPEHDCRLSTFVDITEQKRIEMRLKELEQQARQNEAIFRLVLDNSPEMIVLSPVDLSKRYVSGAVQQVTGFSPEEYLAQDRLTMIHPEDRERAIQAVEGLLTGVLSQTFRARMLHKDGAYRWVESTIKGYTDGFDQGTGYVATIRDISKQKEQEDSLATQYHELSEMAALDELTGLPNRRTFNQRLSAEACRHTRTTSDLSLLLLDVDYFKQYNDMYGHLPGDACLKRIAAALKGCFHRTADLPARFGGEEFVALLPLTELEGARAMAQNIIDAVAGLAIPHAASPYGIVTISVGIACWAPESPTDQVQFVARADAALYQAKRAGRNCVRDNGA